MRAGYLLDFHPQQRTQIQPVTPDAAKHLNSRSPQRILSSPGGRAAPAQPASAQTPAPAAVQLPPHRSRWVLASLAPYWPALGPPFGSTPCHCTAPPKGLGVLEAPLLSPLGGFHAGELARWVLILSANIQEVN